MSDPRNRADGEAADHAHSHRPGRRLGQALALSIVVALALLVVIIVSVAAEGDIDPRRDPVNTVFASRAVIAAVRVTIVTAAVFIVVSMVVATVRGQFVLQVGPVRLSESVHGVATERDQLAVDLASADQTIRELRGEHRKTMQALEETRNGLEQAMARIAGSNPERPSPT